MSTNSLSARLRTTPQHPEAPVTVLVDGSALFLAARVAGGGRALDYRKFVELLCQRLQGQLFPPGREGGAPPSTWVMWTSATSDNAGQNRFLEFAEKELLWAVRRVSPSDSFMVDPSSVLGLIGDSSKTARLIRFDSQIAFAMGRLALDQRIVVVTDSYPLAASLQRAKHLRAGSQANNVLAFFGSALDPRWQRLLRDPSKSDIDFVDLDEEETTLFGGGKEVYRAPQGADDLPF
jgi:hypothetical protein